MKYIGKSEFTRTVEYLNILRKGEEVFYTEIDNLYRNAEYVAGEYKYYNNRWHVNRYGIWYPITYGG